MILMFLILAIIFIVVLIVYISIQNKHIKYVRKSLENILKGNYQLSFIKKSYGNAGKIVDLVNSITEKLQEESSKYSFFNELVNGIFYSIDNGLILTDVDGKILRVSKNMKDILEMELADKYIQETIFDLQFIEFASRDIRKKDIETLRLHLPYKGKNFVVTRFFLIKSKKYLYVLKDTTAEENLKRIKSEFITNLSHELRTPLTALKGYAETLKQGNLSKKDQEKFINIICENIERMTNIVTDLLVLSDIERDERHPVEENFNLNELINDVIALFDQSATKKGLSIKFQSKELPEYRGDRFLIQQLLINLISNSIRFTEKGGVNINVEYIENKFYITVSDTGIGIPAEEISKIFERFYTVDKARSRTQGGTGLGLSIVKHIVRLHNGEIKVDSKLGEGSKFTIILPQQNQS